MGNKCRIDTIEVALKSKENLLSVFAPLITTINSNIIIYNLDRNS